MQIELMQWQDLIDGHVCTVEVQLAGLVCIPAPAQERVIRGWEVRRDLNIIDGQTISSVAVHPRLQRKPSACRSVEPIWFAVAGHSGLAVRLGAHVAPCRVWLAREVARHYIRLETVFELLLFRLGRGVPGSCELVDNALVRTQSV